jgi:hypothetical protein
MDIYRGHESKPTAAYIRELQAGTSAPKGDGDDPYAKIYAAIETGDALAKASLAKLDALWTDIAALAADLSAMSADTAEMSADIERLMASRNTFSDQRGRPENMAPAKWAERNAK